MFFYGGILLYVALVRLATDCYYGSHINEGYDDLTDPYYDNQKIFGRKSTFVAEGGDCGEPLSICCYGLRCRHEFWSTGSRCRDVLQSGESPVSKNLWIWNEIRLAI